MCLKAQIKTIFLTTNRSPFSIVHIIREDDVERARSMYKDVDLIPERNIQTMNKLGETRIKELMKKLQSQGFPPNLAAKKKLTYVSFV